MSGEDDWLVQAAAREAGMLPPAPDSFEDSDRFEGDSECSWVSSESITLAKNWRGWSQSSPGDTIQSGISTCIYPYQCSYSHSGRYSSASNTVTQRSVSAEKAPKTVASLSDLAARVCARQMSFVELERNYRDICQSRKQTSEFPVSHSLPDKLFLSVVFWCFPATADDIRLYSCLANGNADEFNHGDSLYQNRSGYLLSATVCASHQDCVQIQRPSRITHNVSLSVDRCRVVSCDCSCPSKSAWCQHVVALCLFRIHQPNQVQFRVTIWDSVNELSVDKLKKFAQVTIWDSVNELSVDKLKKFAQYLVNELPKEYLPIAQRLLDQLKCPESEINQSHGAPDPTDGGHEQTAIWALDVEGLHTSIRRLLIKYCVPAPTVHCDVQYLGTAQHPIAAEWLTVMKSLRAREPEGIWNLMAIVREMFARRDENAVSLLSILTVECLANCQILLWWYATKLVQSGTWSQQTTGKNSASNQISAQLNSAQLCDEIVVLWRCAVLNPMLSPQNRRQLAALLRTYHRTAVDRIWKVIRGTGGQDAAVVCHALIDETVPGVSQVAVLHLPEACGNDSNVPVQPLAPCGSSQKRNEKGRKKKKKNRSRATAAMASLDFPPLPIFNDEASLDRAVRYAIRAAVGGDCDRHGRVRRQDSLREEDSSESGQESDVQLPSSAGLLGDVQAGALSAAHEEVDAVLAAAYLPMEPIEVRFARCEALAAHGYIPQSADSKNSAFDEEVECISEQMQSLATRGRLVPVSCTTEAHAHYMHELAKRVLTEAGGSQSSVCVRVGDRGRTAHMFRGLTCRLLNSAGQSRDPAVVEEAARLALSVLPYAYTLSAAETQRALLQCREQGGSCTSEVLVALDIEEAANQEIVFADVLFRVARYWHDLHYELDHPTVHQQQHQNQAGSQAVPFNSNNQHQQYFNLPGPARVTVFLYLLANEIGRLHPEPVSASVVWFTAWRTVGIGTRPRLVNAHRVGISYNLPQWQPVPTMKPGSIANIPNRLPPYHQQYSMPPINRSVPPPQPSHSSKAFAHVAGRARAVMLQTYAHPSTAELYERCIEQFYAAAGVKLSHNRFNSSDMEDAHQLLVAAIAASALYPHAPTAHTLLEDFYRHVKKQKAWKKDVQHRLGSLLHEALNQQR
ncbi:SWIM zinc finger domain protein [Ostertagia ostertagi]